MEDPAVVAFKSFPWSSIFKVLKEGGEDYRNICLFIKIKYKWLKCQKNYFFKESDFINGRKEHFFFL